VPAGKFQFWHDQPCDTHATSLAWEENPGRSASLDGSYVLAGYTYSKVAMNRNKMTIAVQGGCWQNPVPFILSSTSYPSVTASYSSALVFNHAVQLASSTVNFGKDIIAQFYERQGVEFKDTTKLFVTLSVGNSHTMILMLSHNPNFLVEKAFYFEGMTPPTKSF
jgi:hypothetical protein